MKPAEKIIIALILLLAILQPVFLFRKGIDLDAFSYEIPLIALVVYYMLTTKPSPVFLAFALIIIGLVAHSLRHTVGMSMYVASIVFGIIVLIKLFREKNKSLFYYGAALALILQGILFLLPDTRSTYYALIMNYFILGMIGTIKMNEMKLNDAIDKGLTFYLVAALIPVIDSTLRLVL